jgi:hypothetical protein
MRADGRIDKRLSKRFQISERALLIATHESAVTGNIRRQHSRQCRSTRSSLKKHLGSENRNAYLTEKWADVG